MRFQVLKAILNRRGDTWIRLIMALIQFVIAVYSAVAYLQFNTISVFVITGLVALYIAFWQLTYSDTEYIAIRSLANGFYLGLIIAALVHFGLACISFLVWLPSFF